MDKQTFNSMAEISAYMDKLRAKRPEDRTEAEQSELMEWEAFTPPPSGNFSPEDYLLYIDDDKEVEVLGYLYKKHYSRVLGQVLWSRKLMELDRRCRSLSEQLDQTRTALDRAKTARLVEYFRELPPAEQEELRMDAGRARNDEELRGLRAKNKKLERELESMSAALAMARGDVPAQGKLPSPFDVKWVKFGTFGGLWNKIKNKSGIIIFAYLAASVGYCLAVTFWG